MSKVIGIITARIASKRLPGKILKDISGKSIFEHHVERMRQVKGLEEVFLATSDDPLNEELIEKAESLRCGWYAGAEQDIVERHIKLCEREGADAAIRVPCDSPLFDTESLSSFVEKFKSEYFDYMYVSNMTMIQGTVKELVSYKALCKLHVDYRGPAVTLPIIENMNQYKTFALDVEPDLSRPEYRLTVDYLVDFELMSKIYDSLYEGEPLSLLDVYVWLDDNPQVAYINRDVQVSGINQYIGNMLDKQLYSVVFHGGKYRILDEKKQFISIEDFINKLKIYFPELKLS